VRGDVTPVQAERNQLSCYTPEIQSHIILCSSKKTSVFSHPQTISLHLFASLRSNTAMDKQPSKRRRLAADTLSSSKDMETALNKSLPKRGCGSRPVQTAPLIEEAIAPVKVQPTAVPTVDGASNAESQGVYPDRYDYGVRYGGHQTTRFNSSLVNDDKADARAEWRYQRHRQSAQPAMYAGLYTTSYPNARSSHFRASFDDSQRESQASPSLDHIKVIMERMERHQAAATSASTASSAHLNTLLSQGKFHSSYRNSELLEICSFCCILFHKAKGFVPFSTLMESIWAAAGSLAARSIWFRLRP
jgi:hypothetical protein